MIQQQSGSRWTIGLGLLVLIAAPVSAGVVYEIEVKDHEQTPPRSELMETSVEGPNLKMGIASTGEPSESDMIYRGDRREMVFVDHEDKSFHVMDEETIGRLAGQVNQAMAQMQEALKDVPAEQRAMLEQMMKQRMPEQAPPARSKRELRKAGDRAEKAGYPCVKYELLDAGRVIRELWVTDWDNIEGGDDVVDAFEGMADFFREMLDAMPDMGQDRSGMGDNFFEHMRELGGFPVFVREFGNDGSLAGESTLRSVRRQTLDPDVFEPPSGYKRRSMGPE